MAIFGGGGRMNAYGEPLVDSTVGEALGGLLGRGVSYLGNRFKDSLFDDKGLVRANPEGPGMPVLGKQKGFDDKTKEAYQDFRSKLYDDEGLFRANPEGPDKPVMGRYKGLDVLKGNKFLGEKEGFDKGHLGKVKGIDFLMDNKGFIQDGKFVNPYKGRYAKEGFGSRIRAMLGGREVEGPIQPQDMSISGAVSRTEEDARNAPNQEIVADKFTGENFGNIEIMGPLVAAKVTNPENVPAKHALFLQKFLNTQGANLEEDGNWGPKSTQAMAEYMQKSGTGNQANVNNRLNPMTYVAGRPGLYQ